MFRVVSTMIVFMMVVIAWGSFAISPVVWAAGSITDCAKAQTWAERNICKNDELASLDVRLTSVFERLRKALSGEARSDQMLYQRGFLNGRDICRTQAQNITAQECLRRIYQDRIAELESYLAAVSGNPAAAQASLNDCYADAANRAGIVSCLQLELQRVDADLKAVAEDMRVRMQKMDKATRADIGAASQFTNSQEAFLKFREASCEWRATAMADNNGAEYTFLACMVDLAHTRMVELETVAADWRPQNSK